MLPDLRAPVDPFAPRHIGPDPADVQAMLARLGLSSLEELVERTVPASIRLRRPLALDAGQGEAGFLSGFAALARRNQVFRSFIGLGYHGTHLPAVLRRNVLENPGWYTAYTPYQAEIAQGRLEALLNFQTVVSELCALPLANASLLDEATAAAEALCLCHRVAGARGGRFLVSEECHPQTIAVVRTRAEALGIACDVVDVERADLAALAPSGVLLQYPATHGALRDHEGLVRRAHAAGALVVAATDLLALTVLRPPGEWGADVAVGSAQRFGVPMGFGGPHAAFLATREEHKRHVPGRIIGLSRDRRGAPALRMAMQTREQHIRREKATSNICTAQVLLAVLAGLYAVYHGPSGLRAIGERVHATTALLAAGLRRLGFALVDEPFFDTLRVGLGERSATALHLAAHARHMNLRPIDAHAVGVSLDETTTREDVERLLEVFAGLAGQPCPDLDALARGLDARLPAPFARTSAYLEQPVFQRYRSEHEMLRYVRRLEARDLSLTTSMIALGSCTMKLNATTEMIPVTWPELCDVHPFAPSEQVEGYRELFARMERALCEITGFAACSLQPNAGSQGEYAGLLAIRAWHRSRGDERRDVCLIPVSAHGTNPASAVLAGMRVVVVACDEAGNVDLADLTAKAERHADELAALMVTYPSTHGVFEERIRDVVAVVHAHGGQVYLDGANMNAQVGLCRPGDEDGIGADVCHLNLHKTFCIPHGGGGPGMGPICVAEHLAPFLPSHPLVPCGGESSFGTVSAAPWGSPLVLPISWAYVAMMGAEGLRRATAVAILNANYMAARLAEHYEVLYRGERGMVAHEFILDLRPFEAAAGVTAEDFAKRLMDYGFHAPTMSFPVPGTLMIEPTESESKAELDRLCDALIAIRGEVRAIAEGRLDRKDNPLKNAPHTALEVCADAWTHAYGRELAAFPAPWTREHKVWPHVARIDNGYGDRHLVCTCPPVEAWADEIPPSEPRSLGAAAARPRPAPSAP